MSDVALHELGGVRELVASLALAGRGPLIARPVEHLALGARVGIDPVAQHHLVLRIEALFPVLEVGRAARERSTA